MLATYYSGCSCLIELVIFTRWLVDLSGTGERSMVQVVQGLLPGFAAIQLEKIVVEFILFEIGHRKTYRGAMSRSSYKARNRAVEVE